MGDKGFCNTTSSKLSLFWESFLKSEANSYERGAWLDLFLAEALIQLQDGLSVNDIISLTSSNAAAILAGEIVSEIERICSGGQGGQGTGPPSVHGDLEEFAPLRSHLLSGRGWRSLALLHALGLQDVAAAASELAGILISIYGIVEGKTNKQKNPYIIEKSSPAIEQVCCFRLPSRRHSRSVSHSSGIEGSPPSRRISTSSSAHSKRAFSRQDRPRIETSESETLENETHKSVSLKIRLDPMDFDYFTSIIRSEDDEKKNSSSYKPGIPKRKNKKLIPRDFRDDRIQKVFHEEVNVVQFRHLVVELLCGLYQSDGVGINVYVQTFNFSLDQLGVLQFSTVLESELQFCELKFAMTRLFLRALDKVILQQESMAMVVQKGALRMMLRLLEPQFNKEDCALSQDFIFGVTYALITFMHSLLIQHSSLEKSVVFLEHFQQFVNCYNNRIIDKTVFSILASKSIDGKVALNRVKRIIGLLSQLILSLKQVRTKFVHIKSCKKQKHKNCIYPPVSHHHDNVFGKVYCNTILTSAIVNDASCVVTSLFMIFTRFLCEEINRDITVRTMQAMMQCGTCCCFPASILISRVLKVVQNADTIVRNLGLDLLEKTIYREVGAIDLVTMCQVCVNVEGKDKSLSELTKHRWACLEAFQDMLLSPNFKIAYSVGSHLMRVTPRCSIQVQREMFFGVFFPVFIASKKKYLSEERTEKDRFTMSMSLSVFSNLLSRVRFAEEFIERDAVSCVLELIHDRNFTEICCLILEIIIIVYVWKLEKREVMDIHDKDIAELVSLKEFVTNTTNEYLVLLKKLEKNSKKEEYNELMFQNYEEWEVYMKTLERLNYLWRSWMNLSLYCPQTRAYFERYLSIHCFSLLSFFLQYLAKNISIKEAVNEDEIIDKMFVMNQLHLKLLESLVILNVISPYAGNPGGVCGLREKLEKVVDGSLGLRSVCDVLIRSAGANASKRTMIPSHQMPKLDKFELGISGALEDHHSESSLENSADEGYDADVDAPCRKIQEKENSLKGSLPPSRRISAFLGERRYTQVTHPELCHLSLHLIVYSHREEKWYKEAIYSLHKISSVLRDNPENCITLSKSNFTLKLLQYFSDLLSSDDPEKYELQQAVLEVFGYLARHSIQSKELATYIHLFTSEKPPLKLLLPCLLKLLNGTSLLPKYILSFPKDYLESGTSTSTPAHKLAVTLHQQHMTLGLTSCWSRAAIFLPINAELGWAMWVQGFSISLWLRINPGTALDFVEKNEGYAESTTSESGRSSGLDEINVDHLLHIISIGYEALVLEFWADGSKELLHIRLTRPDGSKFEVLSEASLEGRLPPLVWHHIAISVHDSVHSGKVIIEVTLIIDGWCEIQVPLSFKGLLVRKARPTLVAVGDTGAKVAGRWDLGGLLMFRKPVLKKSNAIWLTALGPDLSTVTQARVGNTEPLWSSVFSAKTLTAGVPWLKLLDNPNAIKEFQESMLLGYSPKSPDLINVYPPASATLGLGPGFRVTTVEQRSSQLVPLSLNVVSLCEPANLRHLTVSTAVDSLGGIAVFLFLFARVVEMGGSEMEQAQALELYLRLSRMDPYLNKQADSFLSLVSSVLESRITTTGGYMLKAIFDTCCDKPGLITAWGDELSVSSEGDWLLTEPECLVPLLVDSSHTWPPPALLLSLRALLSLLRDDHPYREFNAAQLNRAHALDAILYFCKERLVEEREALDKELCNALVEVTRGLMTAPPLLSHVTAIADYLLVAHPAHATYISHNRSSLYFVLPPRPPPKHKRKLPRNLSLFGGIVDAKEYADFYAQPIDARKLNKALRNLEIQQKSESPGPRELSDCVEVICDSGIAGSVVGNPSTSTQDYDLSSINSANTFFLKNSAEEEPDPGSVDHSSNDTDDDEKFINENIVEEGCESEDAIKTGLLELLHDQILVTPDSVAHTALPNVLSPEAFIVMANHSNLAVITAVVRVLGAYLERASSEEKSRFIKDKGFYLLAMQLSHVTPSPELADALASIVTMSHCNPLSLQTDGDSMEFTLPGIVPLLSLLPKTVADIPLAHNIIVFIHNVFLKINDWKNLLELGLVEVLLKTLVSLKHLKNSALTDLCLPEQEILISDINSFLSAIVVHAIQTSGNTNIQVFVRCNELKELTLKSSLGYRNSLMRVRCGRLVLLAPTHPHCLVESHIEILNEVILQIEYIHSLEIANCGAGSECSESVKFAHCHILQSALRALTETIHSHTSKPSFFSSAQPMGDQIPREGTYSRLVNDSNNSTDRSSSSTECVSENSSVISISSDDQESHNSSSNSINTIGKLSKSDLVERYKAVVMKATEFAVYTEPVNEDTLILSPEMRLVGDFVKEIWNFLLISLVTVIERKSISTKTSWSNTVWANRDILRTLGSQMFLWLLSPNHSTKLKQFTISSILNEPRSKDILMFIINTNQLEKTLAYYLWDLRFGGSVLESRERRIVEELSGKLEEWCSSSIHGIVTGELEARGAALEAVIEAANARHTWRAQRINQIHKVVYRHESLAKEISEKALAVTKEIEESKGHQLKMLMESIKNGFGAKVQAVFRWKELISMLTHQEAVWHFPASYPTSWELDPTEGPYRIRNRLRRCSLQHMDTKYFRENRTLSKENDVKKPLSYLFEGTVSSSSVLIDRLHLNAKIRHMCKAKIITPDRPVPGELLIGHCCLYFVPSSHDNTKEWSFDQIKELHRRRFELQERGLEIFLLNGKTFFMAFENTKERDDFMSALLDCELCNRVSCEPLTDAVELWREGLLTNWQYLAVLNTLAGRTYNDLMQYPVFPFILADYTNHLLDLEDPKSYRNLMKPMAIQEQKNEQHYINHYNDLKTNEMCHNNEPYHYSSHYSNSGIVLHFMVRLPPYTEAFLSYQDNNFDCPDRTFHSLHTTWRLTSSESATDVKELIPEFFFLPEFLCNPEHFDFGTRQSGEVVNDVILPPWAQGSPRLFILIHRQALESWHVREFLPHWIDLVFGYKQVGKAAVDSINVFHPATYSGFDPESIEEPLLRRAWQTMVQMYGQTPRQLFRVPHPMALQSHEPKKNVPQVIPSVKGLSWGSYVGSPGEGQPTVIWQGSHHTPIQTLVALLSNDVFGLAVSTTLLLSYVKESSLSLVVNGGTSVLGAALISWGHGDGIVRAKLRKEQIPFPAISNMTGDTISLCASVPDSNQLWVAYESGKILVYTYKFDGAGGSLDFDENWTILTGHEASVNGIALSRGFSLAVSIAVDGSAILWDMNSLTYVRSLPDKLEKLGQVAISETLGDIATVWSGGRQLGLYSVNCERVGCVSSEEQITAVTFSSAPEGCSVNVIACGMIDGSVRLYSTWDLSFVRKITAYGLQHPILCLAYSHDAQHLYASSVQGQVVIWQASNARSSSKTPRFLNLTSLL